GPPPKVRANDAPRSPLFRPIDPAIAPTRAPDAGRTDGLVGPSRPSGRRRRRDDDARRPRPDPDRSPRPDPGPASLRIHQQRRRARPAGPARGGNEARGPGPAGSPRG